MIVRSSPLSPRLPGVAWFALLTLGLVMSGACGSESSPTETTAPAADAVQPSPTEPPAAAANTGEPSDREPGIGDSSSTVLSSGKSTLTTADHPRMGAILVDGDGFILYMFRGDSASSSSCTGGCARSWPPLIASLVHLKLAGDGVSEDLVGTITREDETSQVTYNGMPLYNFGSDKDPGDARGHGVGGQWFAVSPTGDPVAEGG